MPALAGENPELRRELDLEVDAISHKAEVARLAKRFHHTITFEDWNHFETCVPWALRLTGDATYEGIRHRYKSIYAGADFVEWMVNHGHLADLASPENGCLVFYYAGEAFKHAGVMIGESLVRSKWGVMPRYTHGLAEVPADFGSVVRFFERPSAEKAKALFQAFAIASGLTRRQIILAATSPP